MAKYASSDLVSFGMITEAVEGTLENSAPVPVVLTTGITPDFQSNTITDPTVAGVGEPIDARTDQRGLALTTPAIVRFSDCRPLIAPALRDVFPSTVTIVGSSDIDMLTAGTHQDSSVGAQIRSSAPGSTIIFDDLITYASATANGAESLLARITGFTDSKNNWNRRIKAVWKDGTHSYIDLEPGWVSGDVGFFAEPVAAEASQSPTIAVGTAVRNRFTGAGVLSKTALWQFNDMVTSGKFGGGRGLVGNDISINFSGSEGATVEITWLGYAPTVLDGTDPTGQGFTDTNLYSSMMISSDDLTYLAIVTASNIIVLSPLTATGVSVQVAGNCEQIRAAGSSNVLGVRRGLHVPTGTVDWMLVDNPVVEELAQLGDVASAEKGEVAFGFTDPAGNEIHVAALWNEFGAAGPVPGAQASTVSGSTLTFNGLRKTTTSRSFIWQEIAA